MSAEVMQDCPMSRSRSTDSGRYNPKNAGVALAHQLHDDTLVLYSMAYTGSVDATLQAVATIQAHIDFARQQILKG